MRAFRISFIFFLVGFYGFHSMAQVAGGRHGSHKKRNYNALDTSGYSWVESQFSAMDWNQKVGQLFMVEAYSNRDEAHVNTLLDLVSKRHIGGVIFFQGSPHQQAVITNRLQENSKTPLLIGIDGEWGLSMRLDSTIRFPRQMTLGAAGSDTLVYAIGKEIARQCMRLGIHINFAPVVDINTNPINPVISSRSFGESQFLVTRLAESYMQGMQDHGVLACAKHFPGHGNTDSDSHHTLPLVTATAESIDSVELYPFKELIRKHVSAVMAAHLFIPSLDTASYRASSLSPSIVDGLLRKQLGFGGLIFTDALNMKGVADYYEPGELAVLALNAGNDVLLFSRDVNVAMDHVLCAIEYGELDSAEIDKKVKRILLAKYKAGLQTYKPISLNGLTKDLNTPWAGYLAQVAYDRSLVVLRNNEGVLPIRMGNHCTMASLTLNDDSFGDFVESLAAYAPLDRYRAFGEMSDSATVALVDVLSRYDYVVVGIHNTTIKAANGFNIPIWVDGLLSRLSSRTKMITVHYGNSYSLGVLPAALDGAALVLAHEDTRYARNAASNLLFGVSGTSAHMPVSSGTSIKMGDGVALRASMLQLKKANPYEIGMESKDFKTLDSLAMKLIEVKAAPGCQILVAWKDRIVYHKAFGNHTYEVNAKPVALTDIYDVASVTKVAATALAAMKLVDEGKLDIRKTAATYFPDLRHTNKKDLLVADIMTHTAGLKSWIPFWKKTMDNAGKPSYDFYHHAPDFNYNVQVSDSLYISKSYREILWKEIFDSELGRKGQYVYSDLGLLILQQVIEHISGESLDTYVYRNFYEPMGLVNIMYNPLSRVSEDRIPPTELDTTFRMQLLKGHVHDPAAAMLGGIAGHAGIFSDAYSLAVIMQMLLNGGEYGGRRYVSPGTVRQFTSKAGSGDKYRGLLFDKPDTRKGPAENTATLASGFTFGHVGFTGTAVWADPDQDLIFVFLSNRVFPNVEPNKLSKGRFRPTMMQAIYEIILPKAQLPNYR